MESSSPSSSPAPPVPHPPSVVHFDSSASHPSPPILPADSAANSNWVLDLDERKTELPHQFENLDDADSIERFQKYEADYTRRLMAKYFSRKNLYGGEIFEESTMVEDEIIKSSRWPCTRSFADPVPGFDDHMTCSSMPILEPTINIANGTPQHNK